MTRSKATYAPIAIIGIGLRLPGGVSTPDEFWSQLINKRDGRCRVPADRYNVSGFHGEKTSQRTVVDDHGYFLNHVDLKKFDAPFFAAKRTVAEVIDPQQRLLLEVVWECLESAGQTSLGGSDAGVFVGNFGEDWHNMMHRDEQAWSAYRAFAAGDYSLANLISHEFDLRGPSMTIRTACSASLSGLHLACQALQTGDCDTAVVAGASLIMDPAMSIDMSRQGVMSPSGSCKTFDASADGFARGEAINALLIKPLDQAIQDGDPIRGVIRSTSVNSDGKTSHMGSPSTESQEALIRKAYRAAGIDDFSQTPFFECHGTGTALGDPLEAAAVGNIFGGSDTYIGSVKPNVGHGEGASGITSIIKALLSLENETIPPNINFHTPNPNIPFEKYRLQVPVEPVPWPKDRHARVSVNSFGIGGANAHVILDSAASCGVSPRRTQSLENGASVPRWPQLLPISANSAQSFQRRTQDTKKYVNAHPGCVDDLAFTLGTRRAHLSQRGFCIVEDGPVESMDFGIPLKALPNTKDADQIAFIFTGQGAQWVGMAKSLITTSSSFCRDIRLMDAALWRIVDPPDWTIEHILTTEDGDSELVKNSQFAQPLCTAVQIALVNFLKACGVTPTAVVGHSSGEIAAAYAAGILSMDQAILCAFFRGRVTQALLKEGKMAAIGMSHQLVQSYLREGVEVACENSPLNVTISGDSDAVEKTVDAIKSKNRDVFARLLHVKVAYHSKHMRVIGEEYERLLALHMGQNRHKAQCAFFSTVTGKLLGPREKFGADYWRSNLESPVLFSSAISNMLVAMPGLRTAVEIGPHSALQGPFRQILQAKTPSNAPQYIATLQRGADSVHSILGAIGNLYCRGCAIDFSFINSTGHLLADLPNYPWEHEQDFWKESRLSNAWRMRQHPHHELLGSRCPEGSELEPVWRNVFFESDVAWLGDHRVGSNVVFPCAAYIAMMGEAVMQARNTDAYNLRNLTVKSALILSAMEAVEIRTTMRPTQVTERTNSKDWYDISISTFNGSIWTENCSGQARACQSSDFNRPCKTITPRTRQISAAYFYDRMNLLGLRYGPRFQGLHDIAADPKECTATASVQNNPATQEAAYPIHPTLIDLCLQLQAVAGCKGIARHIDALALPIDIRNIMVFPGEGKLAAKSDVDPAAMIGNVVAVDERGQVVVSLENTKGIPFDMGDNSTSSQTQDLAQMQYLPHIDYQNPADLIARVGLTVTNRRLSTLLDKIAFLGILKTSAIIQRVEQDSISDISRYVHWIEEEKQRMAGGFYENLPELAGWCQRGLGHWTNLMRALAREVDATGDSAAISVSKMLLNASSEDSVLSLIHNTRDVETYESQYSLLDDFYHLQVDRFHPNDFFHLCSHANPTMNVLEIGGGTWNITQQALSSMASGDGVPMYSKYVFTDTSQDALDRAREKFHDHKSMSFKYFDIQSEPSAQGLELGSFDLIVASNVSHTASSLGQTLRYLRSLLRDGGRLFLNEGAKESPSPIEPFIMGRMPTWWAERPRARGNEACVSIQQWGEQLQAAGFTGADATILDDDAPHHRRCRIVSRAAYEEPRPEQVLFLYKDAKGQFGEQLAALYQMTGVQVHWHKLGDENPLHHIRQVISVIDLEEPFFHEITEDDYQIFMGYLSSFRGGMMWLTRPGQLDCTDPRYGVVNGVARTLRVELAIDMWTVEIDSLSDASLSLVLSLCHRFCAREPLKHGVDTEFLVKDGTVHIGRYHWKSLPQAVDVGLDATDPKQLMVGQYGLIDSLNWIQREASPVGKNQVEISIRCVGLNFRDIMATMGLVPLQKDELGFEATGVVVQVGPGVEHVKAGDRVFAISSGLFSTRKVVRGECVLLIPDKFSFEEAATMPVVYSTVVHTLVSLGQVKKGQTVLIHSGTGGVGQAAIHLCKALGVEMYVTVGSKEKAEYLVKNHGIPRERIFDSHSASFLHDVMRATGRRGVDIVLNSLSGELLHASWQCLAPHGKMMEIGKRDILEHGKLALDIFSNNRSFYGVDIDGLYNGQIADIRSVTRRLSDLVYSAHAQPIRPIHAFTANKIQEAFRFMKKGEHMGKIVVTMPEDHRDLQVARSIKTTLLSPTATYLIVGGLGGLGKSVARWMVEKGARNFCFLSRSAGESVKDRSFVAELESQDCLAVAVAGSVVNISDVEKAIQQSPSKIAGVLQMSMVIRDRPALDMSYEDWRIVHDCKVKGTWNLHNAFSGIDLDFFILMSSISSCVGHPGQVNYTSANSFLDSFAQYRQNLGLPCSVINLGGMEGVGFLSERPEKLNQYRSFGLRVIHEQHLVDSIELAMMPGKPEPQAQRTGRLQPLINSHQFVVGLNTTKSLSDPVNRVLYKGDPRVSIYHNVVPGKKDASGGRDEGMRECVAEVEADPQRLHDPETLVKFSREIGKNLFSFLLLPEDDLDVSLTLDSIGIDSLVSIEIRNWWRKMLGLDVTVLKIMNAGTIDGLGKLAIADLKKKHGATSDQNGHVAKEGV